MTKFGEHPIDDLAWWFGERLRSERLEAVRAFVKRVEAKLEGLDRVESNAEVAVLAMHLVAEEMEKE